jgi:class 3 adenylate cyclase/tetratricopeptide (TPR) repeat protein
MSATPDKPSGRTRTRRHLTILFADLSGYTALTGALDPEDSLTLLQELKELCERVISRHGGTVQGSKGDGVMGTFGFPEATERAGRQAVEAALELHTAVREVRLKGVPIDPSALRLHTGVHAGLVTFDSDDPSMIGGEAPNIAARLSDLASDDEILVSASTLGGERHFFEIVDRGLHTLKGRDLPIEVLQVVGRSRAHTRYEARTQGGLTPLVGRTRELETLDALLASVIDGGRAEAVLVADRGIGKTRIAEQFLERAAGRSVQVYRGYCENYLGAEPLQPFLHMLRQVERQVSDDSTLPELQRALGARLASRAPGATPPSAADIGQMAVGLIAALAKRGPLVLFIDDWQWADDATKLVLSAIRDMDVASALILIASREWQDQPESGDAAQVLRLAPLEFEEAAAAIRTLRPDADPLKVDEIFERSGGNPLYIEELCHWGQPTPEGLPADRGDELPPWLSMVIESRVARLPPAQADVVRAAAVIGAIIPAGLLAQVTGHSVSDPIVRELADLDLIFPGGLDGTLRFKHGITRDVVYASVGLREREALHRRIAALIEERSSATGQETWLESLSYHYRAAAMPVEAARYATLAGDRALAAGAPDRARRQYTAALAALDLLEPSDENYRLWNDVVYRHGLACVFDPSRANVAVFARAAERARERNDDRALARASYWQGFIHYALGDQAQAIGLYERAQVHCTLGRARAEQEGDEAALKELTALSVQLLATIGQARAADGDYETALDHLDRAITVKRQHRRGVSPAVGSAYSLAIKGAVLGDIGRFAEAHDCFDEALQVIRAGSSPVEGSVLGWRSAVYLWQGRWDEARQVAARARQLAHRAGSLYVLAQGQAMGAYASWMQTRDPASVASMIDATKWLEAQQKLLSISANYGWLAEVLAEEGRFPEARLYAERAMARAGVRDSIGEATAYRAMSRVPWTGEGLKPEEYLERAVQIARARRSPREEALTALCRGQWLARSGRRAEAVDALGAAVAAFAALDMQWYRRVAEAQLSDLGLAAL